jgi:hypothetical protein
MGVKADSRCGDRDRCGVVGLLARCGVVGLPTRCGVAGLLARGDVAELPMWARGSFGGVLGWTTLVLGVADGGSGTPPRVGMGVRLTALEAASEVSPLDAPAGERRDKAAEGDAD